MQNINKTTTQSAYNTSFDILLNRVEAVRRKETFLLLTGGLFLSFSITLLAILLAVIIEFFAEGDSSFRTLLVTSIFLTFLISFIITTVPHILRLFGIKNLPTINDIALRIGEAYPNIKDNLGNILQLFSNYKNKLINEGISTELIEMAFEKVFSLVKDKDFNVILDKKRTRNILLVLLLMLLITSFSISSSHDLSNSFFRLTNYSKEFIPPAPFTLELITKPDTVLRGSNFTILFKAKGDAPNFIKLYIKESKQGAYDDVKLRLDTANTYRYEISALKDDIFFYGEASWLTTSITTDTCSIRVTDRPLIRYFTGTLTYPRYTTLPNKSFDEQSADLTALRGTLASFNISTNKNIKSAHIVFEKASKLLYSEEVTDTAEINKAPDTTIIPLKVHNKQANGNLRISENGSYYFVLTDSAGLQNSSPIKYSVVALSDDSPAISLLYPITDVQVNEQAILPIKVSISDDYGFSNLVLYYKLNASKFSTPDKKYSSIKIPLPISSDKLTLEVPYIWELSKISIMPEDIYEFYIEVSDNDMISGPKTARTQTLTVRLPSLEEVAQEADVAQTQVVEELQKLKKEVEEVQKKVDELERDLRKKTKEQELDWKQKKQLEDIIQKHNEAEKQMSELSDKLEETVQELGKNKMLSAETMEKYKELQKLMQEVRSPQLERLQKMREEAIKQMRPEDLQKAIEQVKIDEEQFKKNIERTMDVLKRIQAEQKTDALTKRAEEIKKEEDRLNAELNKTDPNNKEKMNELAKKQDNLQQATKAISQDLQALDKLMKEIGEEEMPMKEMQLAQEALDKQNIQHDMQQASDQMKSGEKNKADKSQKNASKKLDNFAKKMQDLKKAMQNKNSKESIRVMQKAIDNMLDISTRQEEVKNNTKKASYNSTRVPEYAQEQAKLFDDLYNVASDLTELSRKSFAVTTEMGAEITNSLRLMRETMDMMTERRMSQAANAQTKSMQSINNALQQMQNSLAQMQKQGGEGACENPGGGSGSSSGQGGSSGMGLGQSMQQLAAEQQALNQAMKEMMGQSGTGDGNSGRLSQEQLAQMQRMAGRQKEMQKTMEQLAQEQKNFGGNDEDQRKNKDGNRLANELKKIADEMKEIASNVQRGNISPQTLERQEKILSRLLDATRSINERDYEKKRESERGKDIYAKSPSGIDLSTQEGRSKAMQELLQSLKQGYNKDFEQIIRKYFEKLSLEK